MINAQREQIGTKLRAKNPPEVTGIATDSLLNRIECSISHGTHEATQPTDGGYCMRSLVGAAALFQSMRLAGLSLEGVPGSFRGILGYSLVLYYS